MLLPEGKILAGPLRKDSARIQNMPIRCLLTHMAPRMVRVALLREEFFLTQLLPITPQLTKAVTFFRIYAVNGLMYWTFPALLLPANHSPLTSAVMLWELQ